MSSHSIEAVQGVGVVVPLEHYAPLNVGKHWAEPIILEENAIRIRHGKIRRFLPEAEISETRVAYAMHLVDGGPNVAARSKPLGRRGIAESEWKALDDAVRELKQKVEAKADFAKLSEKNQALLEGFVLPHPENHPELYRVYGPPWRRRLLVLWGLETKSDQAIAPVEAVGLLRRNVVSRWTLFLQSCRVLFGWLLLALVLAAAVVAWLQWPVAKIAVNPPRATWPQPVAASFAGSRGNEFHFRTIHDGQAPQDVTWHVVDIDGPQLLPLPAGDHQVQLQSQAKVLWLFPQEAIAEATITIEAEDQIAIANEPAPAPPELEIEPNEDGTVNVVIPPAWSSEDRAHRSAENGSADPKRKDPDTAKPGPPGVSPPENKGDARPDIILVNGRPIPRAEGGVIPDLPPDTAVEIVDPSTKERKVLRPTNDDIRKTIADFYFSPSTVVAGQPAAVVVRTSRPAQGRKLTTAEVRWTPDGDYQSWRSQHVFEKPGVYPVTVRVKDDQGDAAMRTRQLAVFSKTPSTSTDPPPQQPLVILKQDENWPGPDPLPPLVQQKAHVDIEPLESRAQAADGTRRIVFTANLGGPNKETYTRYQWSVDGKAQGTEKTLDVRLSAGRHPVQVTVKNANGDTLVDKGILTVTIDRKVQETGAIEWE